jgi:DNA-binding PadR family transcriptional regulator
MTVPDYWATRDLPVLTSIVRRVEATGVANKSDIQSDTGLDDSTLDRSIRALQEDGYCETYFEGGGNFGVMSITGRARRTVGAWPSPESLVERLTTALRQQLADAPTEEQKTRVRKALEIVTGVTREVLVNAAGSALGQAAGTL